MTAKRLHFQARWVSPPTAERDVETGQYLESQVWASGGRLVHVGTEDIEALDIRLPDCRFDRTPRPRDTDHPTYVADGMNVTVPS